MVEEAQGWRARRGALAQRGFTYLWVLLAVAVLSVGLLAVSEVWFMTARRQKIAETEWVGAQFTQAIGSYYQSTPGAAKVYPVSLQDLLDDRRYPTIRRHLRTIYANPFSGKPDWELLKTADGRIRGVRAKVPADSGSTVREFVYQPGFNMR